MSGLVEPNNREELVEWVEEVAGIYFRSVLIRFAGTYLPQHVHDHDHATYVGAGATRLLIDNKPAGDYAAGHAIEIKAGVAHAFLALENNTRLACVHDAASALSVKRKGV